MKRREMHDPTRTIARNIRVNSILSVAALLLTIAVLEGAVRLMVRPCDTCWGELLGKKLPPLQILPETAFETRDRSERFRDLVIDNEHITVGDLWGIFREDESLGYVPAEDTISVNGWWQTNNIGARSRTDISAARPDSIKRTLVFGDSFATGSRVRQEETPTHLLGLLDRDRQVVNLAVDGYGMTQSILRYHTVRDRLAYDEVMLIFTPTTNLARDVNTLRTLMGWDLPVMLPRFVIQDEQLTLEPALYTSSQELHEQNTPRISSALLDHLRHFDAFYFQNAYELPQAFGWSVLYKLWALLDYNWKRQAMLKGLMMPGSDALFLTKSMFNTVADEVSDDGKAFYLVLMPTRYDLSVYQTDEAFRNQWIDMKDYLCPVAELCVDLMEGLTEYDPDTIDAGYDGTHYGPSGNQAIAEILWDHLQALN